MTAMRLAAALLAITAPASHALSPRSAEPLSVADAVRIALKRSPAVIAADAEARAAEFDRAAARAMLRPQAMLNTFATLGDMAGRVGVPTEVQPGGSVATPPRAFADQNLTLMAPIYTGGRLEAMAAAARLRALAARSDADGVRAEASLMVREAYWRVRLGDAMVALADRRRETATEMLRIAVALAEEGKGIEAQAARARAELSDAVRMRAVASAERDRALLDLTGAMGVPFGSEFRLTDDLAMATTNLPHQSTVEEARNGRSEVAAARARLKASTAELGAARAASSPQVYASVMFEAFAPDDMGRSAGTIAGFSISLPILDGGLRGAATGRARAMRERDAAAVAVAERAAERDVRQAWLDIETASAAHAAAAAGAAAARQAYDIALLRVQNQKAIQLEVLDAAGALRAAETAVAQALYDHATAVARLNRAAGRI